MYIYIHIFVGFPGFVPISQLIVEWLYDYSPNKPHSPSKRLTSTTSLFHHGQVQKFHTSTLPNCQQGKEHISATAVADVVKKFALSRSPSKGTCLRGYDGVNTESHCQQKMENPQIAKTTHHWHYRQFLFATPFCTTSRWHCHTLPGPVSIHLKLVVWRDKVDTLHVSDFVKAAWDFMGSCRFPLSEPIALVHSSI